VYGLTTGIYLPGGGQPKSRTRPVFVGRRRRQLLAIGVTKASIVRRAGNIVGFALTVLLRRSTGDGRRDSGQLPEHRGSERGS
jgi:hypothetical protein